METPTFFSNLLDATFGIRLYIESATVLTKADGE